MTERYSIELDCAPGGIRPGDLLPGVIEGLGLTLNAAKPDRMLFGEWTWIIPADQSERYLSVQSTVKERIEKLYHAGFIRWGSW
jgi:hypothetical protein